MTREDMVEAIMPHMGYAGDVMARQAAQAALSALEAMGCVVQAWQGIESARRVGTRVLLSGHRGCEVDIGSWGNGRFLGRTRGYNQTWVTLPGFEVNPTHWMPLPTPPLAAASPLSAPGRGGE